MSNPYGILPCQQLRSLVAQGAIRGEIPVEADQIQPASLDLRLGYYACPVDTSFLSGSTMTVMEKMQLLDARLDEFKIDLRAGAVLEKGRVYVIPLLESVALPADTAGFANPKSSTGRLDILTRLIADYGTVFDGLPAGYKGNLYIEVAPRSFSIVVKTGTRLNQLRLRKGSGLVATAEWEQLVTGGQVSSHGVLEEPALLRVSADLQGDGSGNALIGYRARRHSGRLDLERRHYEAGDFWEPLYARHHASLILDPSEFYILMTREAIAIPPDYAAEMQAYDTRAGEFRVHYAGFFDPGFGWNRDTHQAGSSRAVLEVRSHEVPFLLEHGQTVGWLRYERMMERPDSLYGQDLRSHYQGQGLKLAKQFGG